jgi:uncharacterized protein (TIGR00369 family)
MKCVKTETLDAEVAFPWGCLYGDDLGECMDEVSKVIGKFHKINRFGKAMRMRLEVVRPGEVIYRMKVTRTMESSPNAAHGGAVAALMDSALGVAALTHAITSRQFCSTVEFKMNFIAPAAVGDELIAHGNLDHAGKSLVYTNATIVNQEGKLIAKGLGTFNMYPMEKKKITA